MLQQVVLHKNLAKNFNSVKAVEGGGGHGLKDIDRIIVLGLSLSLEVAYLDALSFYSHNAHTFGF